MTDRPEAEASDDAHELVLRIPITSNDDVRALRGTLLAARATELGEVRRRSQRHSLGYGTDSQRDALTDEVADRRRRWEMLDRLIAALDTAARPETAPGSDPPGPGATDGQGSP